MKQDSEDYIDVIKRYFNTNMNRKQYFPSAQLDVSLSKNFGKRNKATVEQLKTQI